MDQEQQRYERARARVKALKGFYIHATAFVLVNIALFVINVLVGGVWWFNRRRTTVRQVSEDGLNGRSYRRRYKEVVRPREEWIAVPVPDAGVPRE